MDYKIERGLIKKLNGPLNTNVMLDKKTGEVWGTVHAGTNDYVKYNDKNIAFIFKNNPLYGQKWTKKAVIREINDLKYTF